MRIMVLSYFEWVIYSHFLNEDETPIIFKKDSMGNHIQDQCLSFWGGCFPTEQLFSVHTKQRRARIV